ncbi:MAG: mechanosensitive ion channel family protein [Acidimicrobiia bacterium]
MSLLAATAAEQLEKAAACGVPGKQAWLCSTVYDVTKSQRAAEIGDDLALPLRILVIVLIAYVLVRISRVLVRRVVRNLQREQTGDRISRIKQRTGLALLDTSPVPSVRRALRAETIGAVLRSIVSALIWATAGLMILEDLGVNLAAIGIGASIIGVAIGFGSQALVRDFLSGMFMLIEDQYGVGDVIDTGVATGTVEGVSLRTTRLRDAEGTVWHVPNGEIRRVGNKSQQWSRVILDVAVAYDSDLERATAVIRSAADATAADPTLGSVITDEPEVWGVEQVEADHVLIRLAVKTVPLEQWRVARALRARLKAALDDAGIAPASESVITYRVEGGAPERDR